MFKSPPVKLSIVSQELDQHCQTGQKYANTHALPLFFSHKTRFPSLEGFS